MKYYSPIKLNDLHSPNIRWNPDIPDARTCVRAEGGFFCSGKEILPRKMFETKREVILPPNGIAEVDGALIFGTRWVKFQDIVFHDEVYMSQEEQRLAIENVARRPIHDWQNEETGISLRQDASMIINWHDRQSVTINDDVVFLGFHEYTNWGSLIFRVLPKLVTLRRTVGDAGLKFLINLRHQNYRTLLLHAGVPDHAIISQDVTKLYRCKRAVVPIQRSQAGYFDTEAMTLFKDMAARSGPTNPGRRIYVSRRSEAHKGRRVFMDEGDFESRLAAHGFEIMDFSKLPVLEQIKAFAEASVIVGPSGAAMFNSVFCSAGTKIFDIESEPVWANAHANIFESSGCEYHIMFGEPLDSDERPVHRNWRLDQDKALAYILDHI